MKFRTDFRSPFPLLLVIIFWDRATIVASFSFGPFSSVLSKDVPSVNGSQDKFEGGIKEEEEEETQNPLSAFSEQTGETALRQVQFLASKVAESTAVAEGESRKKNISKSDSKEISGIGGVVYNNVNFNKKMAGSTAPIRPSILDPDLQVSTSAKREDQVWAALANLELDMQLLDKAAGQKPQLTALELTLLFATVIAAASGPFILGGQLTEVLAPTSAAFSAAIGIGAEYVGRVSVADGKEVAAATIQCSAEAEGLLANAERAKAITPLCVGVSATATTLSLLVPVVLDNIDRVVLNEIYLACPLVSVLAAAVAGLALQETRVFSSRATSVGNRRFAMSGLVGRTWLSTGEQIVGKSDTVRRKWRTFCLSVLPAPLLGSIVPGTSLATKAVIIAALGSAQTALFLAQSEYCLARATDAVAIKARSAAVCDTYANQASRSSAILPFTSALSGVCAAATAAIVELPFLQSLSAAGTLSGMLGETAMITFFPAFSALFAAAASVSKARCEVQCQAAVLAASTLALEYKSSDDDDDPILRPFQGVAELIQLTFSSSVFEPFQRLVRKVRLIFSFQRIANFLRKRMGGDSDSSSSSSSSSTSTPAPVSA